MRFDHLANMPISCLPYFVTVYERGTHFSKTVWQDVITKELKWIDGCIKFHSNVMAISSKKMVNVFPPTSCRAA